MMRPLLLLCIFVAILVIWQVFRWRGFIAKAGPLHASADQFPHDAVYTQAGDPQTVTYVAMGDSTAYGVGADVFEDTYPSAVLQALVQRGQQVHFVNIGRSGARLEEIVNAQLPKAFALQPVLLTISVGGNDATHLTPPAVYETQMKQLVQMLQDSAVPHIILSSTPHMGPVPAIPPVLNSVTGYWSRRQNDITEQLLAGTRIKYADLFRRGKLDRREWYAADQFHPNREGYARWSPLFIEHVPDSFEE